MQIQIQMWKPTYMHVNPDPSRLKVKASPCFTCLHHLPPAGSEVIFWKQTFLLISGGSFYHWLCHFSEIIQFHWFDCTCFWDQFQIKHKCRKQLCRQWTEILWFLMTFNCVDYLWDEQMMDIGGERWLWTKWWKCESKEPTGRRVSRKRLITYPCADDTILQIQSHANPKYNFLKIPNTIS